MIEVLNYKDHNDNSREISYSIFYGPFPQKKKQNSSNFPFHYDRKQKGKNTHWYHLVNKTFTMKDTIEPTFFFAILISTTITLEIDQFKEIKKKNVSNLFPKLMFKIIKFGGHVRFHFYLPKHNKKKKIWKKILLIEFMGSDL